MASTAAPMPPTSGVAPSPVADEEGLAKLWECDFSIRERLRFNAGKLLVWPKNKLDKEMIGQPSMAALAMNSHILTIMASWWCPTQSSPKTPSIAVVKTQVGSSKEYLLISNLGYIFCSIYFRNEN